MDWRPLWIQLFREPPSEWVETALDELFRVCRPNLGDGVLIVGMFLMRHAQVFDARAESWSARHSKALDRAVDHAIIAGDTLQHIAQEVAKEAQSARQNMELVSPIAGSTSRIMRALQAQLTAGEADLQHAREMLRRERRWFRLDLILVTSLATLGAMLVAVLLTLHVLARPTMPVLPGISDTDLGHLAEFAASGSLSTLMNCRMEGYRIVGEYCVADDAPADATSGWVLPRGVAARAAAPWSAERAKRN